MQQPLHGIILLLHLSRVDAGLLVAGQLHLSPLQSQQEQSGQSEKLHNFHVFIGSILVKKKPGGLVIVGVNAPGGRLALPPLGQKSQPCHQNCLITHTPTKSHPQSHIPTEKITPTPTKSGSRHTHIYKLINTVTYTESIIPYSKLL